MQRAKELDATLYITSILEKDEMNVYQVLDADYMRQQVEKIKRNTLKITGRLPLKRESRKLKR